MADRRQMARSGARNDHFPDRTPGVLRRRHGGARNPGWTPATPVAHAPNFVCGVINLRGIVLPIIDFAARLGFPRPNRPPVTPFWSSQIDDQTIGLLVEGVSEILTISQDLIQPTPDVASQDGQGFRQRHRRHRRTHDQPDRARRDLAAGARREPRRNRLRRFGRAWRKWRFYRCRWAPAALCLTHFARQPGQNLCRNHRCKRKFSL